MGGDSEIYQMTVEAVSQYFQTYDAEEDLEFNEIDISSPEFRNILHRTYAAVIFCSGVRKGFILVTCDKSLLSEFIKLILGPRLDIKQEYLLDMTGEMANTISGYFQKFYGNNFTISPPKFLNDSEIADTRSKLNDSTMIIQFNWIGFLSEVVINLDDDD